MNYEELKKGLRVLDLFTSRIYTIAEINGNGTFSPKEKQGDCFFPSHFEPFPSDKDDVIRLVKKHHDLEVDMAKLQRDYNNEMSLCSKAEKNVDHVIQNNMKLANTLAFYTELVANGRVKILDKEE